MTALNVYRPRKSLGLLLLSGACSVTTVISFGVVSPKKDNLKYGKIKYFAVVINNNK